MKKLSIALISGVSVLCSSCYMTPMGYGPYNGGYGAESVVYDSNQAWVEASYDATGVPIYGYSYGRPVYGYTAAGAAIFTVAAITALCCVPDWGYASWYHGPHSSRIGKPYSRPPHYPSGHKPDRRPSGGMNAPINRNPSSVFGPPKGHNTKPNTGSSHLKPGTSGSHNITRPSTSGSHNITRPSTSGSHNITRPSTSGSHNITRPSTSGSHNVTRPSTSGSHTVTRPSTSGSHNVTRPSTSGSHNVTRPSTSGSHTVTRPSTSSSHSTGSSSHTITRPSTGTTHTIERKRS